jgi:hypothetical protein
MTDRGEDQITEPTSLEVIETNAHLQSYIEELIEYRESVGLKKLQITDFLTLDSQRFPVLYELAHMPDIRETFQEDAESLSRFQVERAEEYSKRKWVKRREADNLKKALSVYQYTFRNPYEKLEYRLPNEDIGEIVDKIAQNMEHAFYYFNNRFPNGSGEISKITYAILKGKNVVVEGVEWEKHRLFDSFNYRINFYITEEEQ